MHIKMGDFGLATKISFPG